jgi:hypothetical protein
MRRCVIGETATGRLPGGARRPADGTHERVLGRVL